MLIVRHLQTFYGQSQALFDVSLQVAEQQVVSLLGRNGMGKTTTVHSIMGLTPYQHGEISYQGQTLRGLASHQIAQLGIGLVPEGRRIFANLSVRENLIATARQPSTNAPTWSLERVLDFFPTLKSRLNHWGNQLSGGEQQMLAIGRALMLNPRLLILDEATEGLAPLIREQIWQKLQALKTNGLAILVIDKNIDALSQLADQHYIIEKGRNVWQGDNAALRAESQQVQQYLGV